MRKLVRTRRRSIRRQVVGCRADDPARARKAHRYERGILQVADMNSDVHAVIEEVARVDAQLELNAEIRVLPTKFRDFRCEHGLTKDGH